VLTFSQQCFVTALSLHILFTRMAVFVKFLMAYRWTDGETDA